MIIKSKEQFILLKKKTRTDRVKITSEKCRDDSSVQSELVGKKFKSSKFKQKI